MKVYLEIDGVKKLMTIKNLNDYINSNDRGWLSLTIYYYFGLCFYNEVYIRKDLSQKEIFEKVNSIIKNTELNKSKFERSIDYHKELSIKINEEGIPISYYEKNHNKASIKVLIDTYSLYELETILVK